MNRTTVAFDLAKSVFRLPVAGAPGASSKSIASPAPQFEHWFFNQDVSMVNMEACGSAHRRARWLNGLGIEMRLLPAQHVRAYVKRNKTNAADAAALLEACRAAIHACDEFDRPSWLPGSSPHRQTPITLPAACLPLVATGASVTQIPCRHGTHSIPQQMPDIRLQVFPQQPIYRSASCR